MKSGDVRVYVLFFFQAEDGIRILIVTGVQTVLFRSSTVSFWTGGGFFLTGRFQVCLGLYSSGLAWLKIDFAAERLTVGTYSGFSLSPAKDLTTSELTFLSDCLRTVATGREKSGTKVLTVVSCFFCSNMDFRFDKLVLLNEDS